MELGEGSGVGLGLGVELWSSVTTLELTEAIEDAFASDEDIFTVN